MNHVKEAKFKVTDVVNIGGDLNWIVIRAIWSDEKEQWIYWMASGSTLDWGRSNYPEDEMTLVESNWVNKLEI